MGFDPGSPHQALDALSVGLHRKRVNWVLDADICGFFDNMDHEWLLKFLEHRIADERILRLIQKWLRAGASEDGEWSETKIGTPQGAVTFNRCWRTCICTMSSICGLKSGARKVATGDMIVVRFADDLVAGFQHRADAERFLRAFEERLATFGLAIHPEKTRLIEFGRYAAADRKRRGEGKPEAFAFLGFTHYCGANSKGYFAVRRKTAAKKLRAKLLSIKQELRRRMHEPVPGVGKWLKQVVTGYFQYHAVPGNSGTLSRFRDRLCRLWRQVLRRRSQRRRPGWEQLRPLFEIWIPRPRVLHPYPSERFYVLHPK